MGTKGIENLPDWEEISLALKGYFSTDSEDIEGLISQTYSSLSNQIPMLPLRFFHRFINEKASLFSNSFERVIKFETVEDAEVSLDELTEAEMWTERYLHLYKQSATKIDYDGKKVSFLALDPNMYFHDEIEHVWYLRVSDTKLLAYVKKYKASEEHLEPLVNTSKETIEDKQRRFDKAGNNLEQQTVGAEQFTQSQTASVDSQNDGYISNNGVDYNLYDNGEYVEVYETIANSEFSTKLGTIDYNKDWKENGFRLIDTLPDFPFVEWKYYRVKKAIPHELAKLQRNYISLLSWGLYNVSPKLLTQLVVKSGEDTEKLQQTLKSFGSTTTAIKVGVTDEVEIFNTGDIKVLTDLFKIYSTMLEQSALQEGVDKNAIVSQLRVESGEAKKVELGYINKARNEFKVPARLYEKAIINKLNKLYGFKIKYEGIVFADLDLASDPVNDIEYATAMYTNHYWTYEQSYAYVNKVTLDRAKVMIAEFKLTEPVPELMRTQVSDTVLKTGVPAPEKKKEQ